MLSLVKSTPKADPLEVSRKSSWGPWWTGWVVGFGLQHHSSPDIWMQPRRESRGLSENHCTIFEGDYFILFTQISLGPRLVLSSHLIWGTLRRSKTTRKGIIKMSFFISIFNLTQKWNTFVHFCSYCHIVQWTNTIYLHAPYSGTVGGGTNLRSPACNPSLQPEEEEDAEALHRWLCFQLLLPVASQTVVVASDRIRVSVLELPDKVVLFTGITKKKEIRHTYSRQPSTESSRCVSTWIRLSLRSEGIH